MARTARASSPKVPWPSPGWMDCTAARKADWSSMGWVMRRSCDPNVATWPRAAPLPESTRHGRGFGVFEAGSGAHAEGVVDDQKHQPAAGERGGVAIDEGIGEGENQQQQTSRRSESSRK